MPVRDTGVYQMLMNLTAPWEAIMEIIMTAQWRLDSSLTCAGC